MQFDGKLKFNEGFFGFFQSNIYMAYRDLLYRDLIIEVWSYSGWGANALLGNAKIPLSSLVHQSPLRSLSIMRNLSPVPPGRNNSVGVIEFSAPLEERDINNLLIFRHFSMALSNALGHADFVHPGCTGCSPAQLCCGCALLCTGPAMRRLGWGESVQVTISHAAARVVTRSKGKAVGSFNRHSIAFRSDLNTKGMALAAETPDSMLGLDIGHPINDSVSFSALKEVKEDRALLIRTSRSVVRQRGEAS